MRMRTHTHACTETMHTHTYTCKVYTVGYGSTAIKV